MVLGPVPLDEEHFAKKKLGKDSGKFAIYKETFVINTRTAN